MKSGLYNLEAERSVLSLIIYKNNIIKDCYIRGEDFYDPNHKKWFSLFSEMIENGEVVDLVTLSNKISENEVVKISEYCSDTPIESHFEKYISIIKDLSNKRKLQNLLNSTISKISTVSIEESVEILKREISEICPDGKYKKGIQGELESFVTVTDGNFSVTNAYLAVTAVTKNQKTAVRMAIQRMMKQGIVEKIGNQDGVYRKIDSKINFVDISQAPDLAFIPISWPMGVEAWVHTSPKSISVIAGEFEAGKSAFLANFAHLNMDKHKILYFSSEMTKERFKNRISKLERPISDWKRLLFTEDRNADFHDVVDPDAINIIDYLELDPAKVFEVANYIRKIFDKLKTGIALIALQKKRGQPLAYGQDWTAHKAELYLTISRTDEGNILKIEKAKNWANDMANPVGMKKKFLLYKGIQFYPEKMRPDWYKGEGGKEKDYI